MLLAPTMVSTVTELYHDKSMTKQLVAKKLGVSYGCLHKFMVKHGIKRRAPDELRFPHLYDKQLCEAIATAYQDGRSSGRIAKEHNLTAAIVLAILKRTGVKLRQNTTKVADNRLYKLQSEQLNDLYFGQKLSVQQIADLFGLSRCATQNWMIKNGIKFRTDADSISARNLHRIPPLTDGQLQLIYGSLLGDACLYYDLFQSNKTERMIECYRIQFAHGYKQLPYLKHKFGVLPGSKITPYKPGFGKLGYRYYFCHTPTLTPIAALCHDTGHKKRVTQEWLEKLTWEGIAYWYQDDGFLLVNKRYSRPTIGLCTHNFQPPELKIIQRFLAECGLETRQVKPRPSTKSKHVPKPWSRLLQSRFKHQVAPFLERIKEFIIPSLSYKIRYIL